MRQRVVAISDAHRVAHPRFWPDVGFALLHEVGGLLRAVTMGPRDAEITGDHGRLGLTIEADAPRWIRQGLPPGQHHRLAIAGQFRIALIGRGAWVFFDLLEDANAPAQGIHSALAAGRNTLIAHLEKLRDVGPWATAIAAKQPLAKLLQPALIS